MRQRVVLLTISLHNMAGGLERNFIRIADHYVRQGHDVHLVTFDLPDAVSFYQVPAGAVWHKIARTKPHHPITFWERLKLLFRLREVTRPSHETKTTLIVFHHGLLPRVMAATLFQGITRICTERNSLTLYRHVRARRWNLGFLLLGFMDKIVVQFSSYISDYPAYMRMRITAIPNAVEAATSFAEPGQSNNEGRYTLLAVGRLCAQKNYDLLISAFQSLAQDFPDWDLRIDGDGESYDQLANQIKEAGLGARVFLNGKSASIASVYASAHLFAMPSKWEGFPNALAEALAQGLPAVGYAGCAGVNQLIVDGQNGLLAQGHEDVGSLTRALRTLMSDRALRVRLGRAAVENMAPYAPPHVYPLWNRLIEQA